MLVRKPNATGSRLKLQTYDLRFPSRGTCRLSHMDTAATHTAAPFQSLSLRGQQPEEHWAANALVLPLLVLEA